MKIDIDRLSEADLVDLNHRIVKRLRLLQQMRSHVQMMEFKVGERVQFQPDGHPLVTGVFPGLLVSPSVRNTDGSSVLTRRKLIKERALFRGPFTAPLSRGTVVRKAIGPCRCRVLPLPRGTLYDTAHPTPAAAEVKGLSG